MKRTVSRFIEKHKLLNEGSKVIVALSGGADSVALLLLLKQLGYKCYAMHCNFHLRGEESDSDEAFVRQVCTRREAKVERLEIKHFDTVGYAKERGLSIEMAARELRYQWFAEVALEKECKAIAVAHHQNDQAETVLLNLKRGTGIRGLCGMRAKSSNPYECLEDGARRLQDAPVGLQFRGAEVMRIPIIRPLLCTTRDYIEHYLRDIRHLAWVEDSTNSDTRIKRNAVREQLRSYSKAEIEHIAATAEHMQGYVDWLEGRETREAGRAKLYEELKDYGFAEVDKIYDALQRGVGGKVFHSATHRAEIRNRRVEIRDKR
jgi:tRNA(Ile)-lysidine synthase